MRTRPYTKLRETTFDLYTETERLPSYFKFLSILSSWLILAGFILFSIAYTSPPSSLSISPKLLTALASAGVFAGYVGGVVLGVASGSLVYVFDGVCMPVLMASALGVFSGLVHWGVRRTGGEEDVGGDRDGDGDDAGERTIYLVLPLVVSGVATVVCGVLSWVVYRKLRKIKDLDARRRAHVPMGEYSSRDNSHSKYNVYGYAPVHGTGNANNNIGPRSSSPMLGLGIPISREVRDMLPDDEAQRRQLMALLQASAKEDAWRAPSVDGSGSTYHIDLPWEEACAGGTGSGSGAGYGTASGVGGGRPRSGSLPGNASSSGTSTGAKTGGSRFTISNLGMGLGIGMGMGRNRSDTAESFKDPRERRREQIERSGLVGGTTRGTSPNPNPNPGVGSGWRGQGQGQGHSPPVQSGGGRYG